MKDSSAKNYCPKVMLLSSNLTQKYFVMTCHAIVYTPISKDTPLLARSLTHVRSVYLLPGATYFPGPNCLVLETG